MSKPSSKLGISKPELSKRILMNARRLQQTEVMLMGLLDILIEKGVLSREEYQAAIENIIKPNNQKHPVEPEEGSPTENIE